MNNPLTLLYVDDEPINLEMFAFNFRKKFNVITAVSGDEGLQKLNENKDIAVVISDMKMPGLNGLDFIEQAKEKFKSVVFFLLTGYTISDPVKKAIEQGVINNYFEKPFNIREIETAVHNALTKA